MQFYYFNVQEKYAKQSFFQWFLKNRTKIFVQKKFVKPLKRSNFSIFHFNEITRGLFHIVITKKENDNLFNCFFDTEQQIFFFEKEENLLKEIQKSELGKQLVILDVSKSNKQLLTTKEILEILK